MQRSESIAQLATALAKAQGAIENAAKDADNPFFRSKYADLASIRDAVRTPLAANGLSCPQFVSTRITDQHETRYEKDDRDRPYEAFLTIVTVETMLLHESGEFLSNTLDLPVWDADPQKVGSASTYGRRYALQSVAGVAAEIDDDGNSASGKVAQAARNDAPQRPRNEPPKIAPKPPQAPRVEAPAKPAPRVEIAPEGHDVPNVPAVTIALPTKPASVPPEPRVVPLDDTPKPATLATLKRTIDAVKAFGIASDKLILLAGSKLQMSSGAVQRSETASAAFAGHIRAEWPEAFAGEANG